MGLDLCVEGRARPGHEVEWAGFMRRCFTGVQPSEADKERFNAICEPPHAVLGAPRVGTDPEADDWIARHLSGRLSREEAIAQHVGYYVLALVQCDGLPMYSNGGLYPGVDETSFRGQLLAACTTVLTDHMIHEAWEHRMPDAAVAYGQSLLAAAANTRAGKRPARPKPSWLKRMFEKRQQEELELDEQLEIVEAAGRWFVFWGSRGHPIFAYF